MEIYLNINGVVRNLIQKFEYFYTREYIEKDEEDTEEVSFEYGINYPIDNDNIIGSFKFNSKDEFELFTFVEYPLEIFGHAGLSYSTTITDLNKLIYDHPDHNFTLVGVDELGKAIPATLFFLSKSGALMRNIKFIRSSEIDEEWKNCDLWVTDSELIVNSCPDDKKSVVFQTLYNEVKYENKNSNKIKDLKELYEYIK